MTIKPLADRVSCFQHRQKRKLVVLSSQTQPRKNHSVVRLVAVGNGTKDEEMILKVGDEVLYGKYAGTELENEGEKYLMMRQSDVLQC